MAPVCSAWCLWSNMKDDVTKAADRKAAMQMVRFCAMVALPQIKHKRKLDFLEFLLDPLGPVNVRPSAVYSQVP